MLENVWNRIRYTVYSPLYDRVAGFGRQRARSIGMLDRLHQEPALLGGLFQIALVRKPVGRGRRH